MKLKSTSLKPKTVRDYRLLIRKHVNPILGDHEIEDIDLPIIDQYFYTLFDQGVGIRTIHYVRSILRVAFNYAKSLELITANKFKQATLPKEPYKEMKILNREQIRAFLKLAKSTRYYVLFFTAISTGMRISELMALTWGDVDFGQKIMHVHRQVKNLFHKDGQFSSPKTKYGIRNIPLSDRLTKYLQVHHEKQSDIERISGWQDNDLIFTSSNGTIITYSHLRKTFKGILEEGQLPDIRLHDLRHTCATLLIEQGVNITAVSRILGHSRPSVTLDFYGHLTSQSFAEIKQIMGEI